MDRLTRFAWPACCVAAALAVLLAYSNHFHNSFHFDDAHTVESNLFIRDLSNVPRFFTDAHTFSSLPPNQSYRPLVTTTLAVDYRFGNLDPFYYHLDSFALFFAQCVFMLFFFRRVLGSRWLGLFGAALYGLHAAIAETVNYVIARGDILSTLFAVIAVLVFAAGGRARRLHLYLIPAALSVLSKEQGAMVAPLLFLYLGLIEERRPLAELIRPSRIAALLRATWPAFVVCGALTVLALKMATTFTPGGSSRVQYLMTQPYVLLHYALNFLLPVQLSADTDWVPVQSLYDPRVPVGLFFVAGMVWLAFRTSRSDRTRPIAFGIAWFFVTLLPTSSLVPLAEVTNDHRLYFPFVGLALAAACGAGLFLEWLAPRLRTPALRALPAALAVLILAGHALGVRARNRVWTSEDTLWSDVTVKSPGNARAWMNWGLAQMGVGKWADAERGYRKALELAPNYGYAHVNMAILMSVTGRSAEAEPHFRRSIDLMPDVPSFRFFYARWLDQAGRATEALGQLREGIRLSPAEPNCWQLLLTILSRQRAWPELMTAAKDALAVRSNDAFAQEKLKEAAQHAGEPPPASSKVDALIDLSVKLYREGKYREMLGVCDDALKLKPDSAGAWNNKCSAFNQLKRFAEAVAACETALRYNPGFELAKNNLAVARAQLR